MIQHVVNDCPDVSSNPISTAIGADRAESLEWLSPKADDDYSEYRDQTFLDLLGIKLSKTKLKDFWPVRGPQWDVNIRFRNMLSIRLFFELI